MVRCCPRRRYKHYKWGAANGLVQGCPLSCIAQNAIMLSLVRAIDEWASACPGVALVPTLYAADVKVELSQSQSAALVRAAAGVCRVASEWAHLAAQTFNADKSRIWASDPGLGATLAGA